MLPSGRGDDERLQMVKKSEIQHLQMQIGPARTVKKAYRKTEHLITNEWVTAAWVQMPNV